MDFGSTSPLFQVPSFTSLMGPVSPAFWDASFGQQTELFPQELKGISPNSVWSSNNHILSAYEPPVFDLTRNQLDFEPKLSPHRSPPSPLNQSPKGNNVQFRDSNPALDPKSAGGASAHLAKKSDWVHSVVTDTPAFYHVLSPSGYFLFASDSIQDLAGYGPWELKGRSITDKLHPDDIEPFVDTFNQCIATRTPLSIYARLRKADGRYLVVEFTGHARYGDTEPGASTLSTLTGIATASPSIAKCIFAVGRLYPSKHTAPLDALLEHKIENEMLQAQAQGLYDDLGIDSLSATGNGIYSQGIDIAGALRSQDTNVPGTFGTYSAPPYATARPLSTSKVASGDDKKKHKNRRGNNEHDYVCHECGTADSPEWRKGPNGPKTLCNACGLRFAKKSRMAGKR